MIEVLFRYFSAAVAIGCIFLMAAFTAMALRERVTLRSRIALVMIGSLLMGVAGLEKLGWSAKPWAVGSPAQAFDDLMFWIFWLAGMACVFTAWMSWMVSLRVSTNEAVEEPPVLETQPEAAQPIV